jgi:hypothetical protein
MMMGMLVKSATIVVKCSRPSTDSQVMWEEHWPDTNWIVHSIRLVRMESIAHKMGPSWEVSITKVS